MVVGGARTGQHQIVEQRVARPGVAGQGVGTGAHIGDVGDATDVDHDDRPVEPVPRDERAMVDRHKRRALPARRHVLGPKIRRDLDPEATGQRRAVADLNGQPVGRAVQHRLAVEPDQVDALARHGVRGQERFDGTGMTLRDHRLGRAEPARAGVPIVEVDRVRQRAAQKDAIRLGIGKRALRSEGDAPFAVGLDQGDVDAVHRRSAHQTDRAHRGFSKYGLVT